jgi:uncharacterized membrane protein
MMGKERMLAFTDGVIAVIITIMVLELKPPAGTTLADLAGLWPVFLAYVLSFTYVGIYWNNHHHLYQLVDRVGGGIMWANLHLLFWISLIPFATAWVGEHEAAPWPTALYGVSLLMAALSWSIMQAAIMRHQGAGSPLRTAIRRDWKGKAAPIVYASGVGLSFMHVVMADIAYAAVALMWLVPDRRMERALSNNTSVRSPRGAGPG